MHTNTNSFVFFLIINSFAALVTCSYCLEGVLCALFSCTSSASVWLIDQLPSLLALQELIPSEMQFVSLIVKKSLIGLKYQPLDSGSVEKALDILEKVLYLSLYVLIIKDPVLFALSKHLNTHIIIKL